MSSKAILVLAGLAAAATVSCNKTEGPASTAGDGSPVSLTVNVGAALTKVTSVTRESENAIANAQVLVFDESGKTEAYGKASSGSVTVGVVAGSKTVWAVANYPGDLSGIKSSGELAAKAVALTDNGPGSLVMAGSAQAAISASNASVSVDVSHLSSKVVVDKITRDFSVAALASLPFTLKGIYLINVVGNQDLAGTAAASAWYNKMGHKDSSADALLYDSVEAGLANKASHSTVHSFYPFPNGSTSTSTSSTWSERKTMLVIEGSLDGQTCYYPIFIQKLERNKVYEFTSITLTRKGSADPYTPVTSQDVSVTLKVTDFQTGASYTETI